MECAIECAIRFAEHKIPFRIVSGTGERLTDAAPVGLVMVRRALPAGQRGTGPVIVLITNPQSETTRDAELRQAPLSFSMSGLAG